MDEMDLLVQNLRVLMERKHLDSQPKLAKASGVSQTHIGNILRRDKIPRLDIVEKLAQGLGVKLWQLFLPTDQVREGVGPEFNALLSAYLASGRAGRETIRRVAEAQASLERSP